MSDLPFGLSADPFALPATLTAEQTARLIEMRVRACGGDPAVLFPSETCSEIHRHAHGVTGAVCDLAGRAMRLAAEAGAPSVSPEHVCAAADPTADQVEAAEVAPVPEAVVPESTVMAADDDIPDLPAVSEGGFALPSKPSKDLAPDARAWVSRFIAPEGAGVAPSAYARPKGRPAKPVQPAKPPVVENPAAADPADADPYALPRIPAERRRVAVSPLPADSPHPERRAVIDFPQGKQRERARAHRTKALAWATAAAATVATVSLGTVVAHRLRMALVPPSQSQAARARAVAPETRAPDSARTHAPGAPAGTAAAPAISRDRVPVSTRPADPSAALPPPTAASPVREEPATQPAPRHALEVAAFLFQDRADSERERLVAEGYPARVVTDWENGAPSYRVVVGSYVSRSAAERAAGELLNSGLVQQARVVPATRDR